MRSEIRKTWAINGLLLAVLLLLGLFYVRHCVTPAHAVGGGWETKGIIAMHAAGEYLVLIDVEKQTIMLYRTQGLGKFRLLGARSYKYDVELEDTANGPVEQRGASFADVYKLYESARRP